MQAVAQLENVDRRTLALLALAKPSGVSLVNWLFRRHVDDGRIVIRTTTERERLEMLRTSSAAPDDCGPEMIAAPARGAMLAFTPRRTEMTAAGPRQRHDGYMMRRAARVGDAFDVMTDQAKRAHSRKGNDAGPFQPPFTIGQVEIAREYATLTERCNASGVKCASLEALRAAASGGGDREVAILRDFQRLRAFHRRIGDGVAKEVRRVRPGVDKRRAIRARYLVDAVCLGGMTLDWVLRDCKWPRNGQSRASLRAALCGALDRMQGYDLARPQDRA